MIFSPWGSNIEQSDIVPKFRLESIGMASGCFKKIYEASTFSWHGCISVIFLFYGKIK